MRIEIEQEEDGRWLTEIPDLPGVIAYSATCEEAVARVKAFALRVLADRLEHGESISDPLQVFSRSGMSQWGSKKARVVLGVPLSRPDQIMP